MCFTQYLDRKDGNHPVVRGCISSKTPLLCENRKPAIPTGAWPVLLCCSNNLCNRDAVPTAPPWLSKDATKNDSLETELHPDTDTTESPSISHHRDIHSHPNISSNLISSSDRPSLSFHNLFQSRSSPSSYPHIISPVYISVLVLGIISLVIIGIIAAVVLKRSNHFYVEQYGALEQQHEQAYLKHRTVPYPHIAAQREYESDEETLSQCSQFYVHVVEPNRQCNNT
ncbi:uncharacterized protein LOC129223761 isoform X2 [Uloborus diversus]|nr:uncharacterized protein LOC129223761 isoform X2 [Uloborus diversus]